MKEFSNNIFNYIRLIAAFQVAFLHAYRLLGFSTDNVFIFLLDIFPGVPIFFILSGFLISASWEKGRSRSVLQYFVNRFLRIFPGLWVCFLFSLITILFVPDIEIPIVNFFIWSLAQLSFFQFYNPDFLRNYGVGVLNGSLWTISVELQFYIFLPIFYVFIRTLFESLFKSIVVFSFFISLYTLNIYISPSNEVVSKLYGVSILPYIFLFSIGIYLQRKLILCLEFFNGKNRYVFMLYLLIVFLGYSFDFTVTGNQLNPISCILLGVFVINIAYNDFLISKLKKFDLDLSYGIYIYHMIIINFLIHIDIFDSFLNMTLSMLLTISLAFISWHYIEKPALKLKYKFFGN
ncbi:acyltransferase family protein [Shewanella frigidimarina]|uniref:acyltransferase family protein n=1 Tax=Shewanella frigidimarina TaxID=56812 RepID=UPI003D7AF9A4